MTRTLLNVALFVHCLSCYSRVLNCYIVNLFCVSLFFIQVIEKDGRDLKPLQLKKYWTDLDVWRFKMFRKV